MEPGKSLTRREFEEVIRRATELAAEGADADEGALAEAEVLRIASEVGLPERHVRRALAEVRAAGIPARGFIGGLFGPATVQASRVVPGSPEYLARTLDEFLVAGQLLQPVRRGSGVLLYRPAVDWASQIARAASATSKRYYVASAKHVEIRLEEMADGVTAVAFEVDPGTRNDHLVGAFLGGGAAGVAAGVGAAFAIAAVAPLSLALVVGTIAGAGVATSIAWATGRSHKGRLRDVRSEVEGILDRLESGESLEPPPPSWRRWVRRHFHGVARDLRGFEGES
jgi:hypothetical protein